MKEKKMNPNNFLTEFKETRELCQLLLQAPHYAKMGADGIFAIVELAKSIGIDPRAALNGGLYYVRGKVEMSARMMGELIRSKGHSVTKDKGSNDVICILHGKRADSGDCWSESFSIEEAQRAGLVRPGTPWITFPRDMLYARALSRLARQLFPDVIRSAYVEGEISGDPNIVPMPEVFCTEEQRIEISAMLCQLPTERQKRFMAWLNIASLEELPADRFDAVQKELFKAIAQEKKEVDSE